jgi:hypothetical protein
VTTLLFEYACTVVREQLDQPFYGLRDGSRGGELPGVTICTTCGQPYALPLRKLRWRAKHKPQWRFYCSNRCKGIGLRKARP